MITYDFICKDEEIKTYITAADRILKSLGYTEHSLPHACKVANDAADLLTNLGYDAHTAELAKIAGYLHDIGNLVNRTDHWQSGAVMAFEILRRYGMPADDISVVVSAIGNHDETTGSPVSPVAAALILADKSDVRRSRVRNEDVNRFDIHDRVNYAVYETELRLKRAENTLLLRLSVDTSYGSVMDFFQIFAVRMAMCKTAAAELGLTFGLEINGQTMV